MDNSRLVSSSRQMKRESVTSPLRLLYPADHRRYPVANRGYLGYFRVRQVLFLVPERYSGSCRMPNCYVGFLNFGSVCRFQIAHLRESFHHFTKVIPTLSHSGRVSDQLAYFLGILGIGGVRAFQRNRLAVFYFQLNYDAPSISFSWPMKRKRPAPSLPSPSARRGTSIMIGMLPLPQRTTLPERRKKIAPSWAARAALKYSSYGRIIGYALNPRFLIHIYVQLRPCRCRSSACSLAMASNGCFSGIRGSASCVR